MLNGQVNERLTTYKPSTSGLQCLYAENLARELGQVLTMMDELVPDPMPADLWRALSGVVGAGARVTVLAPGWDCNALALDGLVVGKRPRHPAAAARDRLVGDLGRFMAQVHAVNLVAARAAGAVDLPRWGGVGQGAARRCCRKGRARRHRS